MLAVGLLYIAFIVLRPSLYLCSHQTFVIKGCWILSKAFSASNEMIVCFFFFQIVYIVEYIDKFLYVELALHLYLIMMEDFFDVFLDSVSQYFIEYVYINVHEVNWSVILYLFCIFPWFGYQVTVASWEEFGSILSVSIVQNNLRSIDISPSLKLW